MDKETDLSAVFAVDCDGTAVNTRFKGWVVRLLEKNMILCLLHYNELPLRHLINDIDGKTSGPASLQVWLEVDFVIVIIYQLLI